MRERVARPCPYVAWLGMAVAKVEPLLTTRNVSGPFDYRLPEAMERRRRRLGPGCPVRAPARGRSRRRPRRAQRPARRIASPSRLEALEAGVPPELVELGRWVGEEYCSTTARGLGLVLPPGVGTGAEARRVRPLVELEVEATAEGLEAISGGDAAGVATAGGAARAGRGPGARAPGSAATRRIRPGHAPPAGVPRPGRRPGRWSAGAVTTRPGSARCARAWSSRPISGRRSGSVVSALARARASVRGRLLSAPRRDRLGQDRGVPGGRPGGAGAGEGSDRPRPRDRPDASDDGSLPAAIRRLRRAAPLARCPRARATTSGAACARARRGSASGRARRLRPGARSRPDRDRRGARLLLQAGERSRATTPARSRGRRAAESGAVLLCGTATPRPESWHELERLELPSRVDGRPLPPVEIVDMRGGDPGPLASADARGVRRGGAARGARRSC